MDIEVWFVSYFNGATMLFQQFPDMPSVAAWVLANFPDPNVFQATIGAGNLHVVKGVEAVVSPQAISVVTQYAVTVADEDAAENAGTPKP